MKLIQLEAGREANIHDCPVLPVILGRQPSTGIAIVHPTISREHAKIFERDGQICVADLNSSNGTYVNGARVSRADLKPGDVLRLGEVELKIAGDSISASPARPSTTAKGAPTQPSAAELFGDDGGIELEEDHLKADLSADAGGTQIFVPRPPQAGGAMSSGSFGGPIAAPPRSVYAQAASRPLDPKRSGNVFTADVSQQSSLRRWLTIVFVIGFAAALFYASMKLTEDAAPDRKLPPQDESTDPGNASEPDSTGDANTATPPHGSGG